MDIVYHDYGIHGTNGLSEKLERLQNIAIRFIMNVNGREHITPYRLHLKLLKLFDRRTLHVASQINRIMGGEAPKYLRDVISLNTNNTRSNNKLIIGKPKNNFQKTSFGMGGPIIWNALPNDIRSISKNEIFKKEILRYFTERLT